MTGEPKDSSEQDITERSTNSGTSANTEEFQRLGQEGIYK